MRDTDPLIGAVRALPPEDWDLPLEDLEERLGANTRRIAQAIHYVRSNPQPISMTGTLEMRKMGSGNA